MQYQKSDGTKEEYASYTMNQRYDSIIILMEFLLHFFFFDKVYFILFLSILITILYSRHYNTIPLYGISQCHLFLGFLIIDVYQIWPVTLGTVTII